MRGTSFNFKKNRNSVILSVTLLIIVVNQVLLVVMGSYVPYGRQARRNKSPVAGGSSDQEEDDMDQTASAPYQRGANNGGDGYEENEPDGPYDETPREAEGQADMEKFFDDHLGASERDGMDKENLPTNLRPRFVVDGGDSPLIGPRGLIDEVRGASGEPPLDGHGHHDADSGYDVAASQVDKNYLDGHQDTNDTNKLATNNDDDDIVRNPPNHQDETEAETGRPPARETLPRLDANGSEIVAVEDEDMDKIYVTNMTNRPFKIDALGGYDPEEDFQAATRDIEEPGRVSLPRSGSGRNKSSSRRGKRGSAGGDSGEQGQEGDEEEGPSSAKDITFNDPETDTLFNDASETDKVTFGHDDPYQSDFEAEIEGRMTTVRPVRRQDSLDDLDYDNPDHDGEGGAKPQSRRSGGGDDDDSDSGWVNDGVDEMDVPSQAYQDSVLDKAAKQQALAERNAADNDQASQQDDANPEEDVNQRMPNAEYMRDDLAEVGVKKAR